jgi:hypothetical protein
MKMLLALAALAAGTGVASAQYFSGTGSNPNSHYVAPHTTNNGTYVQGHQQTNPNNTQRDNYGTSPNVNPFSGQTGPRGARY